MTSTTPPAPTVRDIAYLIELVNEARDHARQIGLSMGVVAIHGLDAATFDAVAADPSHTVPPRVEVRPASNGSDGYRSLRFDPDTVLFSPGTSA